MRFSTNYTPDEVAHVPLLWEGDVVVVGGGSAGSAAATAAGRAGASTLLVESGAFLGGTGTRVLDTFYGFYAPGPSNTRVVGGIGWEVCERLAQQEMSFERPNTYGAGTGVTYEPEALKLVWDDMVSGSGARTLLYALMTAVIVEENTVVGVVVETRRGAGRVLGRVVVDATGEGEVAWRAGAATDIGTVKERQPATATFRVGGVGEDAASTRELHESIAVAVESGDYRLPRREGSIHATVLPGVRHANMTRVTGLDLTDPWDLTAAEQDGRRQVQEYVRFLREQVRGYSQAYLMNSSSRIGVRETRRLRGEAVLDGIDFREARSHEDDIARCGAPIEDHSAGAATRWEYVGGRSEPDDATYGIPYGTMVPIETDGLLVAGRCFSATHEAHASARSIAQCTALGEAAGVAATMAAHSGRRPRDIDRSALRETLKQGGAIV